MKNITLGDLKTIYQELCSIEGTLLIKDILREYFYESDTNSIDLTSYINSFKDITNDKDRFILKNHGLIQEEKYHLVDYDDITLNIGYYIDSFAKIESHAYIKLSSLFKNILPKKELAESVLAFCQLSVLYDYYKTKTKYNPDFNDSDEKFVIILNKNVYGIDYLVHGNHLFPFKEKQEAKEFLNKNRELFEKAKYIFGYQYEV